MTTFIASGSRLGLVVPGDCHVDDEFWRLAVPDATPYVTRTIGARDDAMATDSVREVSALADGPEIGAAARRLRDVAPHAAAYVDTSISFVHGVGGDLRIAERLRAELDCPSIVTSTAVALGLRALGARTMAVMSPYAPELDARLVAYFAGHGIRTAAVHPLARTYPGGTTSRELGAYPAEALVDETLRAVGAPDVDAVFLPCTAVRAVGAIEPLEAALGIPVVTAIGATMWAVLRLAGIGAVRSFGGRLFSIPDLPPMAPSGAVPR